MKFGGITIKPSEVQSITLSRNGHTITVSKDDGKSPKIEGFACKDATEKK